MEKFGVIFVKANIFVKVERYLIEYDYEYCFNGVTNKQQIHTNHLEQNSGNTFTIFRHGQDTNAEHVLSIIEKALIPLPPKKEPITEQDVSDEDKKQIRLQRMNDKLPNDWIFDGHMYMDSVTLERSYYHPNMPQFVKEWVQEENQRREEYNASLPTTNLTW